MAFVFLDKRNLIIGSVVLVVIFVLGIIIGRYSGPKNEPSKAEALVKTIMEDQFSMEAELIKEALDNVNSDSLRSFHKVRIFKMATKTYKTISIYTKSLESKLFGVITERRLFTKMTTSLASRTAKIFNF